jgi:hypothetical protein
MEPPNSNFKLLVIPIQFCEIVAGKHFLGMNDFQAIEDTIFSSSMQSGKDSTEVLL